MLRLHPYDLDVQYVPGKYMYLADTLSRACIHGECNADMEEELSRVVHNLVLSVCSHRTGCWDTPSYWTKSDVDKSQESHLDRMAQVQEKCSAWCGKLVEHQRRTPHSRRHHIRWWKGVDPRYNSSVDVTSHPWKSHGSGEMQSTGTNCYVFARHVKGHRKRSVCMKHQKSQQREPMIPHDSPGRRWQKLAMDSLLLPNS